MSDGAAGGRSAGEPHGSRALGTLDSLYESTRALGLHDSLEELLSEVLDRARELIGFEHAAVMLLNEDTGRLTVEHLIGYGDRSSEIQRASLAVGQGLSGWAAAHRESVRVGDVSQDPRYVQGLEEARSNLAVPLIVGNRVAGVINVESERLYAFTSEHEKLLTVLGTQAALGILAFQAQAQLRQRIAQLSALYRISNLAAEAGALGATLNSMLEIAGEVIPQGQSAVLLLDESRKYLRVAAGQGYQAAVRFLEIPVGQGITGRCAQTGLTQVVHDIEHLDDDEAYIPGVPGARSEVAVPLIADGMIIGVFNAESVEPHAFSDEHVQTLTVIARQAAEVIRSAQLLEETRRLAITDALTGLFNRRHFNQQLEENVGRAVRYDEPLALVFLDVDHFKSVNDKFGHQAGDRCLQALARTLRDSVRDSDQIARIGGEEFAVLLIRADRELALSIAERLRHRIDDLILEEDPPLPVDLTASLGVAFFREDGEDPKTLMRAADRALYMAKRLGRNRVVLASEAARATDSATD
ncbi:MAG: sensor domain-containing diguanylate cyclase [Candidatus Palauibacterales bacterium]|nr:sensor domain-containing diguanylate cyclase [Candidatus Palauibacterales bacterium]